MNVTRVFQVLTKAYNDGYRLIILKGGSRSGKSYAIMQFMAELLMRERHKVTVWRNEKVTCRATIMDDFKEIIYQDYDIAQEFHENKSLATFHAIEEEGKIIFEGADSISKVLGMRQDISIFNEVTEFNEAVFLQITQRTSGTIICDYNPSKSFWLDKMHGREDAVVLHFDYTDNAYCPVEIVKQLNGYNPFHPDDDHLPFGERRPHPINIKNGTSDLYMYQVYCLGIKAEKPGRIYKNWKRINGAEFDDLPYKKIYGLDFGFTVPTAFVEIKWDGDKKIFVKKHIYKPLSMMNRELPEEIIENSNFDPVLDEIAPDPNNTDEIKKLRTAGFTLDKVSKGAGSVLATIKTLQTLEIYVVDELPLADNTVPDDIWDEYEGYVWKRDRFNIVMEEPLKEDDHLMDAIRYGVINLIKD